uniref:Uncharacterized protein n=1 Tax=Anguilla anguilla TaxID=7936 RepID=A0A0E9PTJ3_ANGAN
MKYKLFKNMPQSRLAKATILSSTFL